MLIETEPCGTCSLYNKGIRDSLNYLREGDVKGLGAGQFYVEKMIGYPVDKDLQSAMEDVCKTCQNISVYNKGVLKNAKNALDLADGLYSLLPPEEQSKILKMGMELHDQLKKLLENYSEKEKLII